MDIGILNTLIQIILSLTGPPSPPKGDPVCNGFKLGGSIGANFSIKESAYWLYGDMKKDHETMVEMRKMTCRELAVPVVVFSMMPEAGLEYHEELDHYTDKTSERPVQTWEEYDSRIDYIAEWIAEIPSIIILEPMLITRAMNSSLGTNWDYIISYTNRVDSITKQFPNSWIYIDIGDVAGSGNSSLDEIVGILKKMPANLRGASLNVGSYRSSEATRVMVGEYITCRTGLHYVIDTSRNGGSFSQRSDDDIENCPFDPPGVEAGESPTWKDGSTSGTFAQQIDIESPTWEDELTLDGLIFNRKKRWVLDGYVTDDENEEDVYENYFSSGYYGYVDYEVFLPRCIGTGEGLDAYLWVSTLGYSDGRLFPAGSYHPCLVNHEVECTDYCPAFLEKKKEIFQRSLLCKC